MAWERSFLMMEAVIRDILKKERRVEKVFFDGVTEKYIREHLPTEKCMEKVNYLLLTPVRERIIQ